MIAVKSFEINCMNYAVKADFYNNEKTDEIILSLIGWTSNKNRYKEILTNICEKTGKSALAFDYSGHGESPLEIANTRPAQHFLEVICVFDWLTENYPDAKITVIGTSYGGFMATQLTKYREFDKLILRAPAIYKPHEFYTLNGIIGSEQSRAERFLYRQDEQQLAKHPLLARASSFKGKVLVVVHEKDEQVPKQTTDAYIKAFNADVFVAKGFSHSISDKSPAELAKYQNTISEWLNS